MPARKPSSLINRHETADERQARVDAEEALKPANPLPKNPPSRLKGFNVARSIWRRMMKVYNSLEGEIVTMLDYELLINFCMLVEQLAELDKLRDSAMMNHEILQVESQHLREQGFHKEAAEIAKSATKAFESIVKLDSRADRKRDLIFKQMQSLYLTPRARAGFAPPQKEDEKKKPQDPMEALFNKSVMCVDEEKNK